MIRELADSAVRAYFETLAKQLCLDDPEKLPIVLEGLITAMTGKVRFYRYTTIDIRDMKPDMITGYLCDKGRRGWRLVAISDGRAILEMDYFQDEVLPKDEGEPEPQWAKDTLIGEQEEKDLNL